MRQPSPARRSAARAGRKLPILLLLLSMVNPRPSSPAEIEGVGFAERHSASSTELELHCVGLLRYMVFIKGYVAALYLPQGVPPEDVLTDVPKRLEINYFHPIKGSDFAAATDQGITANVDSARLTQLRDRIDRINRLYRDVKPGDRYSLTYIPGSGTELALNGQARGTIPGADFASAVFAIWLGPRPLDESLKNQLLRCS
jgi:hypothetical protein